MATPTKSRTSLWSGATLTASSASTSTTTVNLSATFESQVNIKLTNGATGPTVAAQAQIVVGNDTTPTLAVNFGGALVGSTSNNGVSYFSVTIPIGVESVSITAGSNTGQNVTIDADISSVTAIA